MIDIQHFGSEMTSNPLGNESPLLPSPHFTTPPCGKAWPPLGLIFDRHITLETQNMCAANNEELPINTDPLQDIRWGRVLSKIGWHFNLSTSLLPNSPDS